MRYTSLFAILMASSLFLSSCDNGEEVEKQYEIPTTYNFDNVNYSGQTARIKMLDSLSKLMRTGREGLKVNYADLEAIYKNTSGTLFGSDKQLFDKTFEGDRQDFLDQLQELSDISGLAEPGAVGKAGVEGGRLFNAEGVEPEQAIIKGLMGAILYYQATTVYLGVDKMSADNEEVIEGSGTAMEHHWDESFGYLAVPIDFPTNVEGLKFLGSYSNQRDEALGCNKKLMDAYLKGRAAISNNDLVARDEAIIEIKTQYENIIAASAIHYINETLANIADRPERNHVWSEGYGFLKSLKYNEDKKITTAKLNELIALYGTSPDALEVNDADLIAVKNELSTIYGFDNIKDTL